MASPVVCKSTARLDRKTAVITGANTGIGKTTAQDFYKRGARVIMACRNIDRAEKAAADIVNSCDNTKPLGTIIVTHLDLSNLESIRKFANNVLEQEDYIHLLINNAGVLFSKNTRTKDGFENHFGINHLGHFLLTLLLLPRIIKSKPARIVNVASISHSYPMRFDDLNWDIRPINHWQAYCESKLANILFTKELARKLQEAKIESVTTYSLHPGSVNTDLLRDADIKQKAPFVKTKHTFTTPYLGAQTTIYCAVDEALGNETGLYYDNCRVTETSSIANRPEDATLLWNLSMKMVGLDEQHNLFTTKY